MLCPACGLPLLTIEVEGVELDYCAEDLGVWFDAGEIEALFAAAGPVVQPHLSDPRGKRRCPRCRGKMLVHRPAPELELDLCALGDGVWFDSGEIVQLAQALKGRADLGDPERLEAVFDKLTRMIGGRR